MLENHDSFIGDVNVEKMSIFVSYTRPKILSDAAMPAWSEILIHIKLYRYFYLIKYPARFSHNRLLCLPLNSQKSQSQIR